MLLTISVLQRLRCKQDITIGLGDIQNTVYNNTYFDSIEKKDTRLDHSLYPNLTIRCQKVENGLPHTNSKLVVDLTF